MAYIIDSGGGGGIYGSSSSASSASHGSFFDRLGHELRNGNIASGGFSGLFEALSGKDLDPLPHRGSGGSFDNFDSSLQSLDWSSLSDVLRAAFSDLSSSSVQAEKQAAEAANAFTEKMWNKQAEFNAAQADKANAFTEYLQRQAQDYNTEMSNTYYQRLVEDLRKAGLNPALGVQGLNGQSATSGSSSGQAASVGSTSSSKANVSGSYSVNERLLGTLLSSVVSILIARESNATKLDSEVVSGLFGLANGLLSLGRGSGSKTYTTNNNVYNGRFR